MNHASCWPNMSGRSRRNIQTWSAPPPKARTNSKSAYVESLVRRYTERGCRDLIGHLARPPLAELFAGVKRAERRHTILRAHVVHGYLLMEIANYLELHPTTISRIVNETGSYRLTRQ